MNFILEKILIVGGILFYFLIVISIIYYYVDNIYYKLSSPRDKPFKWLSYHKWLALRIANIPFPKKKPQSKTKNKTTTPKPKKGGKRK